jgi:hypothetical protein
MFSMFGDEQPTVNVAKSPDDRRAIYMQALQLIDREENLIHYRMSWGLQWNVATFALLVALQSTSIPPNVKSAIEIILTLFGEAICLSALFAVIAAHTQSWYVIRSLCVALGDDKREWKSEFIRPYGHERSVHRPARWLSSIIFIVLIILWGALYWCMHYYGWVLALVPPK